jgi:hypothetical protein
MSSSDKFDKLFVFGSRTPNQKGIQAHHQHDKVAGTQHIPSTTSCRAPMYPNNITTLHIHSIEGSLFPGFSSVKALSKLEQFAINLNEKHEIGPVLQTVSVLPKLDYLWIRNCEQMQTDHLKYIAELKYLTQLQLGSPIQLHNDSFQYVSTLTNLQVLKFSRCLQLDPAIIKSYWSNCNVEYEKWNLHFNWNTTPYF